MKEYMSTSKWIVFNNKGERIKEVTLKHKDGGVYKEIDPFEAELKVQGLYAHRAESFNQDYLKGKSFKEKLKCLCWEFDKNGIII
jgi:hypothetical protein